MGLAISIPSDTHFQSYGYSPRWIHGPPKSSPPLHSSMTKYTLPSSWQSTPNLPIRKPEWPQRSAGFHARRDIEYKGWMKAHGKPYIRAKSTPTTQTTNQHRIQRGKRKSHACLDKPNQHSNPTNQKSKQTRKQTSKHRNSTANNQTATHSTNQARPTNQPTNKQTSESH